MMAELQVTQPSYWTPLFKLDLHRKAQKNWDKQLGSNEDLVNRAVDKEQIKRILKLNTVEFLFTDHSS